MKHRRAHDLCLGGIFYVNVNFINFVVTDFVFKNTMCEMKRIAALTMVRDSEFFLSKWTSYYGRELGRENLFVFFDGTDQVVPDCTDGCNVEVVPRVEGDVRQGDKGRALFLSEKAADLMKKGYDMVIGADVDEILVADPALGLGLAEFLSRIKTKGRRSLSGLGCDVIRNIAAEPELDTSLPILSQRSFALLSTRYTKTSVLCAPVRWGSGFHRTKKGNYHIVKDLYLMHFGCADTRSVMAKMSDKDLSARGWDRHLAKRKRLIESFPELRVRNWDRWVSMAVKIQTVLRPLYAWNKPAMFGMKVVVRIPERFSRVV